MPDPLEEYIDRATELHDYIVTVTYEIDATARNADDAREAALEALREDEEDCLHRHIDVVNIDPKGRF